MDKQTPDYIYAVVDRDGNREHPGRHQNFYLHKGTATAYADLCNQYEYRNKPFSVVRYRLVPAPEEEAE